MTDVPSVPTDVPIDSEEWFLEQLEKPDLPVDLLTGVLDRLAGQSCFAQAEARAKLLQDILAERGDTDRALAVLERRVAWMPAGPDVAAAARDEAAALVGADTDRRAMLDEVGFDRDLAAAECVRRFRTLRRLCDGALCYDKTWGFGVVRRMDHFQRRVEIDFDQKHGHGMSFAYASESLQILPPEHLLAVLHRDPDGTRAMAKERPGDLVRLALSSFGPMTVVQLQERLSPRIFPESEWKPFWEGARKALKKDALVEIPSKRTEPIRLHARREEFGAGWFRALGEERDIATLLEKIEGFIAAGRAGALDAGAQGVLANRIQFAITGAGRRHPGFAARAVLAAAETGVGDAVPGWAATIESWRSPEAFIVTVHDLPARSVGPLLAFLSLRHGADFRSMVIAVLDRLDIGVLAESIALLRAAGMEVQVADRVRGLVAEKHIDVELLLWLHRNPECWPDWGLGPWNDCANLTLTALEKEHAYARLRAQNQLRERFIKPEWIRQLMDAMSPAQRREFFLRVKDTNAWPSLDRQAVLGRIVKIYPEMEELLRNTVPTAAPARRLPLTSNRSFRERHQQLRKIVEQDIPQNSRDIAHARSYGDLRENFEYKAAKETQAVLLRRQAELEQMLKEVQPSDFAGLPVDRAGIATDVELELPGGRLERYHILGVWDRDEKLGIIGSETRMAKAIEGRAAGDTVLLPSEHGEPVEARIRSVGPLPEAVLRWARGED